jgi:hypothetical protein
VFKLSSLSALCLSDPDLELSYLSELPLWYDILELEECGEEIG